MAYDTKVTQDITGMVYGDKVVSQITKGPVGDTRAFVETVNDGMQLLINNDATLNSNKLDCYHGGNYVLKSGAYIDIDAPSVASYMSLKLPLKIVNDGEDETLNGSIYETQNNSLVPQTSASIVRDLKSIYQLQRFYGIRNANSVSLKYLTLKLFAPTLGSIGRLVTFANLQYTQTAIRMVIRIYWDYDKYLAFDSTGYTENIVKFGEDGLKNITFATDTDPYNHLMLNPISWNVHNIDGTTTGTIIDDIYSQSFA